MEELITKFFELVFPSGFNPYDMVSFLGFIIAVVFILAVMIRVIHQKASKYNHALASAMAILFAYTSLMWLHGGILTDLVDEALRILPLIEYDGEKITLFRFAFDKPIEASAMYLHTFILAFILIALDDLIPDAKNGLAWIALQVFITALTLVLYWFFVKCVNHFLPNLLSSMAPVILVAILLFTFLLGVLRVIVGLLLAAVNPLLIAIGTFFSTNGLGQALGKAGLCALFLCVVCVFMVHNDMGTFVLSEINFLVCAMPLAVLVGLWFVVGNVL